MEEYTHFAYLNGLIIQSGYTQKVPHTPTHTHTFLLTFLTYLSFSSRLSFILPRVSFSY